MGHDKLASPLVVPQYTGTAPAVKVKSHLRGACQVVRCLSIVTSPLCDLLHGARAIYARQAALS